MNLTYGSVCSGIEAASVAWEPIGMKPLWFAEIETFPSEVLNYHWPEITNHGDMTKLSGMVKSKMIEVPDILVGGTPCQAFSIAGLRESLNDDRGQLTLEFVRLANAIDTRRILDGRNESIVVWENVPGVLNTKDNAFGNFLAALCGEDEELQPPWKRWSNAGFVSGPQRKVAWRILDAQYFGVAQRRRRVFVVASARDDFDPAEVLFEFDGVRRDIAPSREARKEVTELVGTIAANAGGTARPAGNCNELDFCVVDGQQWPANIASTLNASFGSKFGLENQHIDGGASLFVPDIDSIGSACFSIPGNWIGRKPENGGNSVEPMVDIAPCQTRTDMHAVAHCFDTTQITSPQNGSNPKPELSHTLNSNAHVPLLLPKVRRLTPTECERLQGFPDGYTQIPWKGKSKEECPDGLRYKAFGNSMAVPVMRWIGERILNHVRDYTSLDNGQRRTRQN